MELLSQGHDKKSEERFLVTASPDRDAYKPLWKCLLNLLSNYMNMDYKVNWQAYMLVLFDYGIFIIDHRK